jgi:hypothetical protein
VRDGAGGADGGISAVAVPPSCLQGAFCSNDPGITPCPSGYDCDFTLTPPQCVRLYCLPKGVPTAVILLNGDGDVLADKTKGIRFLDKACSPAAPRRA